MVLNPTGDPDGGVEADLVQEHMNLLGKVCYHDHLILNPFLSISQGKV